MVLRHMLGISIILFTFVRAENPLCISLGSSCAPALNLRSLNLRKHAYPFDWLISPSHALINALNDDFKYFLTDLAKHPNKKGVIDHYGFQFMHDWPNINEAEHDVIETEYFGGEIDLREEWQEALPLVREKYRRRIERLNDICLNYNDLVIFIRSDDPQEHAIQLRDFLRKKYPHLNFILLACAHNDAYRNPWNIEGIMNFYMPSSYDAQLWKKMFEELGFDFSPADIRRTFKIF